MGFGVGWGERGGRGRGRRRPQSSQARDTWQRAEASKHPHMRHQCSAPATVCSGLVCDAFALTLAPVHAVSPRRTMARAGDQALLAVRRHVGAPLGNTSRSITLPRCRVRGKSSGGRSARWSFGRRGALVMPCLSPPDAGKREGGSEDVPPPPGQTCSAHSGGLNSTEQSFWPS